jgi:hypothetical protein
MVTPGGSLISSAAARIASTAEPSDTPGAVSKPTVVAGYCETCVICSGARRSMIRATDESGVASPEPVRSCTIPSDAGDSSASDRASRMTRYWLVSVKMVDTMRWPKALYSASSMLAAEMLRRAAVSRSMSTYTAALDASASVTGLRTCLRVLSFSTSRSEACATAALSAASMDRRYWVGPVSASMVRSCVGCRYSVMPGTAWARRRSRSMMSCWSSWLFFRLINMRPVCSIVLLLASTPTKLLSVSTSGSCMIRRATSSCCCAISEYDTDCAASIRACSWPVSCVGNKPLGIQT